MSLSTARQIARQWRDDIRQNVDPKSKEQARLREEERRHADTFAAAFEAYAEEHLTRLRTGAEAKRSIERHALPAWRSRAISEIRRADVKELIRGIHKSAPVAGNRLLALLKTFFAWCAEEELIVADLLYERLEAAGFHGSAIDAEQHSVGLHRPANAGR